MMGLTALDGGPANLFAFPRRNWLANLGIDDRAAGDKRGGSLNDVKNVRKCVTICHPRFLLAATPHPIFIFAVLPAQQLASAGIEGRHFLAAEVGRWERRRSLLRVRRQGISRVNSPTFDNCRSDDRLRPVRREGVLVRGLNSSRPGQEPKQ